MWGKYKRQGRGHSILPSLLKCLSRLSYGGNLSILLSGNVDWQQSCRNGGGDGGCAQAVGRHRVLESCCYGEAVLGLQWWSRHWYLPNPLFSARRWFQIQVNRFLCNCSTNPTKGPYNWNEQQIILDVGERVTGVFATSKCTRTTETYWDKLKQPSFPCSFTQILYEHAAVHVLGWDDKPIYLLNC